MTRATTTDPDGVSGGPSLAGRSALVTGAGRGFGEQAAVELAAMGATVWALDVDGAAAARVAASTPNVRAIACDIADADGVERAVASAREETGPITVLVNNAGIASFTPFVETTFEELDRVLDVNLTGMLNVTKAVVPDMVAAGFGRIVNVSSVAGKRGGGFLGKTTYSTSKAGVIGFTKALARELAPHGITVNAVAPGAMDTEMTRVLREDAELLARLLQQVPLGRRGTIQDVADAIAFLCSDLASYLTGETIDVDGGVVME